MLNILNTHEHSKDIDSKIIATIFFVVSLRKYYNTL